MSPGFPHFSLPDVSAREGSARCRYAGLQYGSWSPGGLGTRGSIQSSWARPLAARSAAEGAASCAGLQQALHRRQVCSHLQGQRFQLNHLYYGPLPLKGAMTTQLSPSSFPSHVAEGQTGSPTLKHSPAQTPRPAYPLQVTQPRLWGHSPAAQHTPGLLGTLTGLTGDPGKAALSHLGRSTLNHLLSTQHCPTARTPLSAQPLVLPAHGARLGPRKSVCSTWSRFYLGFELL